MFDLVDDAVSHKLISDFFDAGKIVSAVCHGPIALAKVKLSDGSYLVDGQPVTGFSNVEEKQAGHTKDMPFLLEDVLQQNGGKYETAEPWGPKVVIGRSGKLITGQNPASAKPLGEAIKKALAV
jgi:putative intracellular protease/amidase